MWTTLNLKLFKCYEKLSVQLGPLTLLAGLNAAGKSTVIHPLLILNQSIRDNEWGQRMILNGSAIRLGTVGDVVNSLKGTREFSIGLESASLSCTWHTKTDDRLDLTAKIREIRVVSADGDHFVWGDSTAIDLAAGWTPVSGAVHRLMPSDPAVPGLPVRELSQLALRLRRLTYICAERIGPRETYPFCSDDDDVTVGVSGERTAWILSRFAEEEVSGQLVVQGYPPLLQRQAEAWLNVFFPGAGFVVERVAGANLITLRMRASQSSDFYRPQNVGYGLTHVLPIVTACLVSKAGDLLIIENPEAHLHPSGQTAMGAFLSRVAAAGVQVIVETHSDHVLNGVRRAVKVKEITPSDVAIHYVAPPDPEGTDMSPKLTSPVIDESGALDVWPRGFFDQFEKDMSYLIDW